MSFWSSRNVLVTGGASFIGSHLVERVVGEGAAVRVGARWNGTPSAGTEPRSRASSACS